MDKMLIFIVGAVKSGKSTLAQFLRRQMVDAGLQHTTVVDLEHSEKVQRAQADHALTVFEKMNDAWDFEIRSISTGSRAPTNQSLRSGKSDSEILLQMASEITDGEKKAALNRAASVMNQIDTPA